MTTPPSLIPPGFGTAIHSAHLGRFLYHLFDIGDEIVRGLPNASHLHNSAWYGGIISFS